MRYSFGVLLSLVVFFLDPALVWSQATNESGPEVYPGREPDHVAQLEGNAESWNQWRESNPNVKPQLQGVNLTEKNMVQWDLSDANLVGAVLTRANLTDADLSGANLSDATLIGTDLQRATLTQADLSGADLSRAVLIHAQAAGAVLLGTTLKGANFTGGKLAGALLRDADLTGATLTGVDFTGADLTNANLDDAVLLGADFPNANLRGVSFSPENLPEINYLATAKGLAHLEAGGATDELSGTEISKILELRALARSEGFYEMADELSSALARIAANDESKPWYVRLSSYVWLHLPWGLPALIVAVGLLVVVYFLNRVRVISLAESRSNGHDGRTEDKCKLTRVDGVSLEAILHAIESRRQLYLSLGERDQSRARNTFILAVCVTIISLMFPLIMLAALYHLDALHQAIAAGSIGTVGFALCALVWRQWRFLVSRLSLTERNERRLYNAELALRVFSLGGAHDIPPETYVRIVSRFLNEEPGDDENLLNWDESAQG